MKSFIGFDNVHSFIEYCQNLTFKLYLHVFRAIHISEVTNQNSLPSLILFVGNGSIQVAFDVGITDFLNERSNSKIIVSSYLNSGRPSKEKLGNVIACQQATGADVIKLVVDVVYITDVAPVFHMLTHCQVLLNV